MPNYYIIKLCCNGNSLANITFKIKNDMLVILDIGYYTHDTELAMLCSTWLTKNFKKKIDNQ